MISVSDAYSGNQTPFICLRARLSQVWMKSTVCILVLYIIKLIFLKQFLNLSLSSALDYTLSTCSSIETAVTSALNAPREAAILANTVASQSASAAVDATFKLCNLLILAAKETILFAIEITLGTWTCLTVSLFNIAATESLDLAESAVKTVNDTVVSAANDISDFIIQIEGLVNDATGLINEITSFVTGQTTLIKKVNISLSALKSIQIPSNVTTAIDSLKNDIPTYDDAQTAISKVISVPFDLIKEEVSALQNGSQFKPSFVGVPPKREVALCNETALASDFDSIKKDVTKLINLFIGLCIVGILFAICLHVYAVYRRWRRLESMAQNIDSVVGRTAQLQDAANMSAISFATMSGVEGALSMLALRFAVSKTTLLWMIQYTCNDTALGTLYLGIMGLAMTFIEYVIVWKFQNLTGSLEQTVNKPVADASALVTVDMISWKLQLNNEIANTSSKLNKKLLGWANTGTLAVNNTLSTFMSEINGEINKTLGDTPFYSAVKAVVDCVIGNKVERLEKGLTWVHQHSQISLPQLEMGNNATWVQTANSTQNAIHNRLDAVCDNLQSQLKVQMAISCAFIAAWLLSACIAAAYVLYQAKKANLNIPPPWSASSEQTFDFVASPVGNRATRFFDGPRKMVRSKVEMVTNLQAKSQRQSSA